jgi:UDP-glucose:(heptosyl)LPS alpha-1,3-glucosyltransferase
VDDVRIAVISPFVDRQHGTERAVAELVDRLAARYKDEIDLYSQSVNGVNLKPDVAAGHGGIAWHRVRSFPGPHLLQFLGWIFLNRRARRRQERTVRKTPDVVFSPGINALDADVILVHAIFHRVAELQKSQDHGGLHRLHRKVYYAFLGSLERRVYTDPQVTLAAVSQHTAEQLARYFGRKDVTVIPNGVDQDHFSPAAIAPMRERCRQETKCSPKDFVLLLIGNDWNNKGLKTTLEAFARCEDLPLRLLVVGHDSQAPFRDDARRLGFADRVEFLAPVEDVRIFYAAADTLVAPSLEDSFNMPVLEAMSCGLPVVVSSRAGISDWLTSDRDSVVLEDPESVETLAHAIRALALNPARQNEISANALQTAKRFSWDAHASAIRELMVRASKEKSRLKSS